MYDVCILLLPLDWYYFIKQFFSLIFIDKDLFFWHLPIDIHYSRHWNIYNLSQGKVRFLLTCTFM